MCDDEDCFDCVPGALESEMSFKTYPWRWSYVAVNGLRLVADLFGAVENFHRATAQDVMAGTNHGIARSAFHEEAALEIESITATPED